VFWVISVYFNIRNTLPKFGTFLLGHPVYCTNMDTVVTETVRFLFVLLRHNITQQHIFKMLPWKQQCLLFELLTHVCQKYKINTSFATERNNAFSFNCCYKYVVRNIHRALSPQLSILFDRAIYGECVSLESIKFNDVFI
jgi:hypothetical protein